MEHEFETPPASPAIKAAAGFVVVLVVAVISHFAGFVDLGFGGGSGSEVSDDSELPATTEVPERLAFDEDGTDLSDPTDATGSTPSSEGGDGDGATAGDGSGGADGSATQPTIVAEIELNPEVTSTTTSTTTTSTTTTEAPDSSTTTEPELDENGDPIEPELDENGDPIEDDPADEYQPVIRTYNDNDGGSS